MSSEMAEAPKRTLEVAEKEMLSVFEKLSTTHKEKIDLLLLGSPPFTLGDFKELSELVVGKRAPARPAISS